MSTTHVLARSGAMVSLPASTLTDLRARLRGDVVTPEDPSYDPARALWNGMFDRRPALIVRCGGGTDVCDAVRFVREHDLVFSVRGGGRVRAAYGANYDRLAALKMRYDPDNVLRANQNIVPR